MYITVGGMRKELEKWFGNATVNDGLQRVGVRGYKRVFGT